MSESTDTRDPQGAQPADFEEIYDEYNRPIYRYLLRLTENEAEAEDLTQEAFVRVHRGLPGFRGDSSVKTWLYRIASNVFLDHTRRASTKQARVTEAFDDSVGIDTDWADEDAPRPEKVAEQSEMSACVQEHVEALPESYKTVLVLHDDEGLKVREIADVLGCSEATAKIRLHRAREKLRASLDAGCDFSRDEQDVFVCERKAPGDAPGGSACSG
jgi:RNA polymerase sigma-70 factor (ECF subfamily)